MAKPDQKLQKQIEEWALAGQIQPVFQALSVFADLKHAELPPLSAKALKAITGNPAALQELCLGLASPSVSVRRFSKKYLPKTAPQSASFLLLLAVESLEPMRPVPEHGESMIGSFGGYASPVGQHVRESRMSFQIKSPAAWSDAGKYYNEVLQFLTGTLTSVSFSHLLLLKEATAPFLVAMLDQEKLPAPPWDSDEVVWSSNESKGTDFYRPHVMIGRADSYIDEEIFAGAKKGKEEIAEAARMWAEGKVLTDDPRWEGKPEIALRARFHNLSEMHRKVAFRNLRRFSGRLLPAMPKERRIVLYLQLDKAVREMEDDGERKIIEAYMLKPYRKSYPDEWLEPATEDRMQAPAGEAAPEVVPAGPAFHSALYSIQELAEIAGQPAVWKKVKEHIDSDFGRDEPPPQSSAAASPEDERLLEEMLETLVTARKESDAARHKWIEPVRSALMIFGDEKGYIPDSAIESAAWGEKLLELLMRQAMPWVPKAAEWAAAGIPDWNNEYEQAQKFYFAVGQPLERLLGMAVQLLPQKLLLPWGKFWSDQVLPYLPPVSYDTLKYRVLVDVHLRRITTPELLMPILLNASARYPQGQETQYITALFYLRDEPVFQAYSREIVQKLPLPLGTEMYKRRNWNQPFEWMMFTAWQRKDAQLLASALERCALPFYWKGTKACIPDVDKQPYYDNTASGTHASARPGVDLEDIWALVQEAAPERIAEIVANAFRLAEIEELPRMLLPLIAAGLSAADSPLSAHAAQILELLESSQEAVAKTGLGILAGDPRLMAGHIPELLEACERCLASVSTGVAKSTLSLLGDLAAAYPESAEPARDLIGQALYQENTSVLEQALKSLKKTFGKKEKPSGVLSNAVVARLRELEASDPARFGKLVNTLV